jgi:hypothetical protein
MPVADDPIPVEVGLTNKFLRTSVGISMAVASSKSEGSSSVTVTKNHQ